MRILKFISMALFILLVIGVILYFTAAETVTTKVAEKASEKLEESGQIETIKTYIEQHPEISQEIQAAKDVDVEDLSFTTTSEAIQTVTQKISVPELYQLKQGVESGELSPEDVFAELETKLSEEEMTALKHLAYKELYEKNAN